MTASLEALGISLATPGGRRLFQQLELSLTDERVALVGRNGAGKSTLLAALAGEVALSAGRVRSSSRPVLVPQIPAQDGVAASQGELRRRALERARASGAEILLLDEPTEDLDDEAVAWLRGWLSRFRGCLLVASHDRRLLGDFRHFFVVSEGGCRYFRGSLPELDAELEREHERVEQSYLAQLGRLAAVHEHEALAERRKARKKRQGRCRELDRATPRIRLNQKRSDAQVSHGKLAGLREARLAALRSFCKASRRALGVRLALALEPPTLPKSSGPCLRLRGLAAESGSRCLFEGLHLALERERVAVVGPNGAGKSTLLETALGRRAPTEGTAWADLRRIGAISQGARDWLRGESLIQLLRAEHPEADDEVMSRWLVAHRFPLALAQRALSSLSPGERTRAALIQLFHRSPAPELLVLDEPTFSLDLLGQRALVAALRAWPGGLLVASHDRPFLQEIGVARFIELGPSSRRRDGATFGDDLGDNLAG